MLGGGVDVGSSPRPLHSRWHAFRRVQPVVSLPSTVAGRLGLATTRGLFPVRLRPMALDVPPATPVQSIVAGATPTVRHGHEVCASSALETTPNSSPKGSCQRTRSPASGAVLVAPHLAHSHSGSCPWRRASPLWGEARTRNEQPEAGAGTLPTWPRLLSTHEAGRQVHGSGTVTWNV